MDLISDALPFGYLWYGKPNAASNAIGCAILRSRFHDVVILMKVATPLETQEHQREFNEL